MQWFDFSGHGSCQKDHAPLDDGCGILYSDRCSGRTTDSHARRLTHTDSLHGIGCRWWIATGFSTDCLPPGRLVPWRIPSSAAGLFVVFVNSTLSPQSVLSSTSLSDSSTGPATPASARTTISLEST